MITSNSLFASLGKKIAGRRNRFLVEDYWDEIEDLLKDRHSINLMEEVKALRGNALNYSH